jgi:peptide/nickel transport system substrate-binding protein
MTIDTTPQGLDRRTMLKMAALMGGAATLGARPANAQDAARIAFVDPAYRDFYNERENYFLRDAGWVEETLPRITWPRDGDRIPEFKVLLQTSRPDWIDAWRRWAVDAEKVGIKYNVQQVSQARYLEAILSHRHGDVEVHNAVPRVERLDPSEWLVSRAYGKDRRNYGEWANRQYDAEVEAQARTTSREDRMRHVHRAQAILADDLYITQYGWGPQIIQAYNSAAWSDVVSATGFGIADFNIFHTYLRATPKTNRRRAVVGVTSVDRSINLISAANRYRAIGRMIYDRLAFLDENLNVIPWAAESWTQVDSKTWDLTLRDGMEFHDGRPVTVHDLKYTFDFLMAYDRGFFWTANSNIENVEIRDEARRVVRISFKQPYAEFETYFLILNVIFPKHVWERLAAEQGLKEGEDARRLVVEPRDQIGSAVPSGSVAIGVTPSSSSSPTRSTSRRLKSKRVVMVVVPSVDGTARSHAVRSRSTSWTASG